MRWKNFVNEEKGASLLLESAIIMPIVFIMIIFLFYSATIVLQKNSYFANMYHYSHLVAQSDQNDALLKIVDSNLQVDPRRYVTTYEKNKPYAFLKQKNDLSSLETTLQNYLNNQKSVYDLNGTIQLKRYKVPLRLPKMTLSVTYQLPMFTLLQPLGQLFQSDVPNGYVQIMPLVNYKNTVDTVQLAKQLYRQYVPEKFQQTIQKIVQKIHYFLKKLG